MRFSEAKQGRIFVIRLEHGDVVHECIEKMAADQEVRAGALIVLGGADRGSRLVVGPEDGASRPVSILTHVLDDVREVAGTGTLFPDDTGAPILHMHMACGRNEATATGCIRRGVTVWHVMEVILFELTEATARRKTDPDLGFALLEP